MPDNPQSSHQQFSFQLLWPPEETTSMESVELTLLNVLNVIFSCCVFTLIKLGEGRNLTYRYTQRQIKRMLTTPVKTYIIYVTNFI